MPMEVRMTVGLARLMATASGLVVANLYYNQPLLELMAASLNVDAAAVGAIPLLTQLGYAAAMLFIVPLGDIVERRALIVAMTVAAALALGFTASASSLSVLCVASFVTGFTSGVPQLLVPFAAHFAPAGERGRFIGIVMGGLLVGVLGGRVVAGLVGAAWGWHAMYAAACVAMLVLAALLRASLPRAEPIEPMGYGQLLRSIGPLIAEHWELREAALTGACSFGAFSAFWATLVFFLQAHYGYGARAAGIFSLAGIVGALAAPLAGRSADRRIPRDGVRIGAAIALAGYVCFASAQLWGLIVGVLLLDLGVNAGMVFNQTRIFALAPHASSRVGTVYMVSYFCGGALGSGLASVGWVHGGWLGVCGTGAGLLLISLALLSRRTPPPHREE